MISDLEQKDNSHLYKTGIIQQTAYWSAVKKLQGIDSLAYNFRTKAEDLFCKPSEETFVVGDFLIMLQYLDKDNGIAYVPYGPETEPSEEQQGYFLEQLSEALRHYLPTNCILIRYDLSWQSQWANEDDCYDLHGNWIGLPSRRVQEMRVNFNTEFGNLRKANTDILPSNTIFMNLRESDDLLLGNMKSKTRYNINLAKRKGVRIESLGLESLEIWYELYRQTAKRNNYFLHDINYFRIVLSARANNSESPADVYMLVAYVDDEPLAAMFLVVSANRATYLYGASSTENRNYM